MTETKRSHSPDSAHARYAPSSAYRWSKCPTSVRRIEALRAEGILPEKDESGEAAERGSCIHEIASLLLGGHDREAQQLADDNNDRFEGETSATLMELAEMGVKAVDEHIGRHHDLCLEKRYSVSEPFPIHGTSDLSIVRPGEVVVGDFKYGRVRVDAHQSTQLACYGFMAAENSDIDVRDDATFTGIIIQPKADRTETRVDIWTTTMAEVRSMMTEMAEAYRIGEDESQEVYNPSLTTCRYCPARANCDAVLDHLNATLNKEALMQITKETTAKLYDACDLAGKVKEAIEEQVRAGRITEGFKLANPVARRVWNIKSAGYTALVGKYGAGRVVEEVPMSFKNLDEEVATAAEELGAIETKFNKPRIYRTKEVAASITKEDVAALDGVFETL